MENVNNKIYLKNKSKFLLRLTNGNCSLPFSGGSGYAKSQSGLCPLCVFVSATFGARVNAPHCPITCPKRQLPRTLCASLPRKNNS